MDSKSKIYIAGHRGLVGSAMVRLLTYLGYERLFTATRQEVDLTDPVATKWFFSVTRPEYVFMCAARVGGIKDNADHQVEFLCENLAIQQNVILNAVEYGVKKLVFLGSNCMYPRECPQPIKEKYLLAGPLEKTNEAYAIAKLAGVKLCEYLNRERGHRFVSAMPCNLFGPNDTFDGVNGHLIPGMMTRMYQAKLRGDPSFKVWGNSTTFRELLYSDDLAHALLRIMREYDDPEPINTGSGREYSMHAIANYIKDAVGYGGALEFDRDQPSGTPRKLLDNTKIFNLGWLPETSLPEALARTYTSHFDLK